MPGRRHDDAHRKSLRAQRHAAALQRDRLRAQHGGDPVHRRRHLRSLQRQRLGRSGRADAHRLDGQLHAHQRPRRCQHPARHPARQVAPPDDDRQRAELRRRRRSTPARRRCRRSAPTATCRRWRSSPARPIPSSACCSRSASTRARSPSRRRRRRASTSIKGANSPGTTMSASTPDGTQLYGEHRHSCSSYDVVILPCEGSQYDQSRRHRATSPATSTPAAASSPRTTATTGWHYANSPFNKVGMSWRRRSRPFDYQRRQRHPGRARRPRSPRAWPSRSGSSPPASAPSRRWGSSTSRRIATTSPASTRCYAQDWITYDYGAVTKGGPGISTLRSTRRSTRRPTTWAQPQYCGRAVFSDFHVTANALDGRRRPAPSRPRAWRRR